jgi:XPG N-terminal domain
MIYGMGYDSHLMGFFYRTIRMVEQGIKPMYVFDGKPPDLKAGVVRSFSCFGCFSGTSLNALYS